MHKATSIRTNTSLLRQDTMNGESYTVAPCVLIKEGIWNNVFYPASELSKHVDSWNGRPVVAPGHPMKDGKPVTANSKDIVETMTIGMLFNTQWDDKIGGLRSEAWINNKQAAEKTPDIAEHLKKNTSLDVSTGLFTDDEIVSNVWRGKEYDCIARNHRPDHLAVLLGEKGACSWEDGAGLPRINTTTEGNEMKFNIAGMSFKKNDARRLDNIISHLIASAIHADDDGAPLSYDYIQNLAINAIGPYVRNALGLKINQALTGDSKDKYLAKCHDLSKAIADLVVNEVKEDDKEEKDKKKGGPTEEELADLKKRAKSLANEDKDDEDEDEDEDKAKRNKKKTDAEDEDEDEDKDDEDEDEDKAKRNKKKTDAEDEDEDEDKDDEDEDEAILARIKSNSAFRGLSQSLRRDVVAGLKLLAKQRAAEKKEYILLVEALKANKHCTFTDEQLSGFDIAALRSIVKMIPTIKVNYGVKPQLAPKTNDTNDDVPEMVSIDDVIKANNEKGKQE